MKLKEKTELLKLVGDIFISDPAEHIELFEDGTEKGIKVDTVVESIKHDFEHIDAFLHSGELLFGVIYCLFVLYSNT